MLTSESLYQDAHRRVAHARQLTLAACAFVALIAPTAIYTIVHEVTVAFTSIFGMVCVFACSSDEATVLMTGSTIAQNFAFIGFTAATMCVLALRSNGSLHYYLVSCRFEKWVKLTVRVGCTTGMAAIATIFALCAAVFI